MKLECEIVTPLMMHGSDPKKAELRVPSIKGALRFWWRAIQEENDIASLKRKEGLIFGDTGHKSSIILNISHQQIPLVKNNKSVYELLKDKAGIQYLFYPLNMNKEGTLFSQGKFSITTRYREMVKDIDIEKELIETLNYLNFFGNIAGRGRRGAGSVKFKHEKLLTFSGSTKKELMQFIKEHFPKRRGRRYSKYAKAVYLFDPKLNWKDALESIGKPFKDFRLNNKSRVLETPNFGFPIRHRDRSVFTAARVQGQRCQDMLNRRSSPLLFKIYKSDNNLYFPMIVWLDGELIPQNYEIVKKERNCRQHHPANENIIHQFFHYLTTQGLNYEKI